MIVAAIMYWFYKKGFINPLLSEVLGKRKTDLMARGVDVSGYGENNPALMLEGNEKVKNPFEGIPMVNMVNNDQISRLDSASPTNPLFNEEGSLTAPLGNFLSSPGVQIALGLNGSMAPNSGVLSSARVINV